MWIKLDESEAFDEASIRPGMALKKNNPDWRPDYGNVLILAGGAGSGKGFAFSKAIEFDGKKYDVDELKERLRKYKRASRLSMQYLAKYGKHLDQTDLSNPEDVKNLHQFVKDNELDDKVVEKLFNHIEDSATKPNVVFDVTLKNVPKLVEITTTARNAGYSSKCIHLIWVLNEHDIAAKQNSARSRRVPEKILDETHIGVSETLNWVLKQSDKLADDVEGTPVLNGDIWIFFNKSGTDNFVKKSGRGGLVMDTINAVKIKTAGREMPDFDTIMNMNVKVFDKNGKPIPGETTTLREKIASYVPTSTKELWNDIDDED